MKKTISERKIKHFSILTEQFMKKLLLISNYVETLLPRSLLTNRRRVVANHFKVPPSSKIVILAK